MSERDIDFDRYVDYKEMYLKMIRYTEAAIDILEEAQRECEEMYINAVEQRMDDFGISYLDCNDD